MRRADERPIPEDTMPTRPRLPQPGPAGTYAAGTLNALRALRDRSGWTAEDASEAFGYGPTYLRRVESGERPFRAVYWLALCALTGHDPKADVRPREGSIGTWPHRGKREG